MLVGSIKSDERLNMFFGNSSFTPEIFSWQENYVDVLKAFLQEVNKLTVALTLIQ